jgi:hypothetical protein
MYQLALVAFLGPLAALFGACASGDVIPGNGGVDEDSDGSDELTENEPGICLLHNCNSDAECGACTEGRTSCLVAEHRCVACDAATGTGCAEGQECSSWGNCVDEGQTCPTDSHGTPTFTCAVNKDCAACDPMHQICDPASKKCVACTDTDTSECLSTDVCVANTCSGKCPATCDVDNDCAQCGGPGAEAHACNAHKCAECSPTYACPAGEICSPQGTCVTQCGTDNTGNCQSDAECAGCAGDIKECHQPINGGAGKCGPSASGCSDLGESVAVLPDPWNDYTNLCSNDGDCAGVGAEINVGKMLRDLTGIDEINDANVTYGMNVCADVSVGSGSNTLSCGICVPCEVDSDCNDIDIDNVALQAFGPLGSLAAALLLDQVFGPNDHKIHMYCEGVAGGYGVCAPCPGFIYDCSLGTPDGGGTSGGGGTCSHDVCETGGPLGSSCDSCAADVCYYDSYCCDTAWDAQCVAEVDAYCSTGCGFSGGGGGSCAHDECEAGGKLSASCSSCASDVCSQDAFCCNNQWDAQCVSEAEQICGICGGGSSSGGGYGYCYHDECSQGMALDPYCSDCAASVCNYDSYCCDTEWDATCVDEAYQICGC